VIPPPSDFKDITAPVNITTKSVIPPPSDFKDITAPVNITAKSVIPPPSDFKDITAPVNITTKSVKPPPSDFNETSSDEMEFSHSIVNTDNNSNIINYSIKDTLPFTESDTSNMLTPRNYTSVTLLPDTHHVDKLDALNTESPPSLSTTLQHVPITQTATILSDTVPSVNVEPTVSLAQKKNEDQYEDLHDDQYVVLIDGAKEVIKNTKIEDSTSCVADESRTKDDNTRLLKRVIDDNKYASAEGSDTNDSSDSTEGSNESNTSESTEGSNKSDASDSNESDTSESTKDSNDSDAIESTKGSNDSEDGKLEQSSEEEIDEDSPENILTGRKMSTALKTKLNMRREMAKVMEKVQNTHIPKIPR
jgi:hypothetical protein